MSYRNAKEFFEDAKRNGLGPDEAKEAYQSYVSEGGSFSGDVDVTQPEPQQQASEPGRPGFGSRLLGTIGTGLEYLDRYTGAPMRQGLATAQRELANNGPMPGINDLKALGKGAMAGLKQIGRPTSEAATGRDIAENMGATGLGAGALGLAYDIALDPTNFIPGKAITGALKGGAKTVAGTKAVQNTAKALKVGGESVGTTVKNVVKGGLARASAMDRQALEAAATDPKLFAQAKAMAGNLTASEMSAADDLLRASETVKTGAQSGIESVVGAANPNKAYSSGAKLKSSLDDAAQGIGERFGKEIEPIIEAAGDRGLQYKGPLNRAAYNLNKIAKEAGANASGTTGIASQFGGKAVLDGEGKLLRRIADEAIGIEDVQGLIDFQKGIFARIKELKKTPEGAALFSKNSGGTKALDEMYSTIKNEVGDHIELRIKETTKGARATPLATLTRMGWDDAHQLYAKSRQALENVGDVVGVNVGADIEDLTKGLSRLSIDDMHAIKALSKSDPVIKPVFKQISDSFIDGIVIQATKDGKVNPLELRKYWNDLGPSREILFDKKRIAEINGALDNFDEIAKNTRYLGSDAVTAGSAMRQATGESVKAKYIQQQLDGLDKLMGLSGDNSLLQKAKALKVASGIQSGVTMARTGLGLGGAAVGYHQGEQQGGIAGGVLGALAGAYATSPGAAIAAYRVLNAGGKMAGKATQTTMKTAGHIGGLGLRALEVPRKYRAGVVELGRLANREEEQ